MFTNFPEKQTRLIIWTIENDFNGIPFFSLMQIASFWVNTKKGFIFLKQVSELLNAFRWYQSKVSQNSMIHFFSILCKMNELIQLEHSCESSSFEENAFSFCFVESAFPYVSFNLQQFWLFWVCTNTKMRISISQLAPQFRNNHETYLFPHFPISTVV